MRRSHSTRNTVRLQAQMREESRQIAHADQQDSILCSSDTAAYRVQMLMQTAAPCAGPHGFNQGALSPQQRNTRDSARVDGAGRRRVRLRRLRPQSRCRRRQGQARAGPIWNAAVVTLPLPCMPTWFWLDDHLSHLDDSAHEDACNAHNSLRTCFGTGTRCRQLCRQGPALLGPKMLKCSASACASMTRYALAAMITWQSSTPRHRCWRS